MAASPLPRWAPTPSPTRPLRVSSTGQTAMSSCNRWAVCGLFSSVFAPSGRSPPPSPAGAPANAADDGGRVRCDPLDCVVGAREPTEEASPMVFLTWEDLSVTAAGGGRGSRAVILDRLSGYARPGEVLALMGPSGCGKTTLLDALAGRLNNLFFIAIESYFFTRKEYLCLIYCILNKCQFALIWLIILKAYVTQETLLMATLTVTEVVHCSAQLQLPDTVPPAEKRARADRAIQQMGLAAVAGNRIGGRVCKGISGGQRRRVSICVELLASPALVFLDEPTSGLDSAASFHVMSRIARLARDEKMTVVAAVHQPSSEVFQLFHGLCLLAYGRMVYFGPAADAIEFFDANGYPCPLRRNPSDHFLTMINKDFEELEEGSTLMLPCAAEVIQTLVDSLMSRGSLSIKSEVFSMQEGAPLTKKRQATFFTKCAVLTKRSCTNMHRDMGYYWLRFGIYIGICVSIGTIFFNVGNSFASIQARASMLMFTSTLLTMMSIGGFPSFVEDMKIFRKEQLNGHYDATAFVISNTLSSTPYLGIISIMPGAIAYYLTGLQRGFDHFIYFAAVLWACTMLVEGLMMIVAAIVPDFLLGIITGSGMQGLLMLNAGFFRLPSDIPKPIWKYPTYYISYHKYAIQGLYKNEFLGLAFEDLGGGGFTVSGEYILKTYLQAEMGYSKWVDLAILLAMVLIYRVLFLVTIKVGEAVKPMIKCISLKV
ncbi:ABC transporter G family member 11 [Dichanthelium oligosanthes]|uniref:ABC transporter G family member 11 n=1 Tax=Dichanthelium oligosanthes TaxID=888268 RepID=A0A1E5W358_9POAL|nr:ABC transporter G family member 11 [Dichanthelium oligosanthes]